MSYFGIPIRNGLPIGLGSVAPLASGGGSPFSPLSLFSGGAPGAWYDPSDYGATGTLFQDSAGTTPVTAVEQPVRLMLDKSQGLVLGPELFASSIPSGTGWTGTNASAVGNVVTFSAQFGNRRNAQTTEADKWYRFTFKARRISGNTALNIFHENSPSGDYTAFTVTNTVATYQVTVRGRTGGGQVNFGVQDRNTSGWGDLEVYDLTVTSLAGNHAFQTTNGAEPKLSARYNLLTKTEDFDDAIWTVTQATKTPAQLAPDGTNTAVLVTGSAGNNVKFLATTSSSAATSNTFRFYVKNEGANFLQILYLAASGTSYANFNISTGTLGPYSGAVPTIAPSEYAGWSVITFTETTNAANSGVRVCIIDSETAARNSTATSTGSFTLWHPSFLPANQSTLPYQRVNTATDYATTGFLPYLKFDGVDDSLSTNSISFTSTDKMSVFAGVRKLSDAAVGMIYETSQIYSSFSGAVSLYTTSSNYKTSSGGSVFVEATSTSLPSPLTNVLTELASISGDQLILRVNGVQNVQNTGDQGTGNFGNYPLFIGRRNNASFPFNGQLYSMVIVGKAVTAGELSSTETYVNQKTGAY